MGEPLNGRTSEINQHTGAAGFFPKPSIAHREANAFLKGQSQGAIQHILHQMRRPAAIIARTLNFPPGHCLPLPDPLAATLPRRAFALPR